MRYDHPIESPNVCRHCLASLTNGESEWLRLFVIDWLMERRVADTDTELNNVMKRMEWRAEHRGVRRPSLSEEGDR